MKDIIKLAQEVALTAVHVALIGRMSPEEIQKVLEEAKVSLAKPVTRDAMNQVDVGTFIK